MKFFQFLFISIIIAMLFSCKSIEKKPLTLIPLFSDHMVLQQQDDAAIWGHYTPKQKIEVTTTWGEEASTVADLDGNWKLNLPTPRAGGPFKVNIITTDSTITFDDVMIGEVWLASGQSNMEMPLKGYMPNEYIDNYEQEIASANYPAIRMFTVERDLANTKQHNVNGNWQVCSPQSVVDFSAVGYFYARILYHELGVPIGIVNTSWGGTEAEAWASKESLIAFPEFTKEIETFDGDKIKAWIDQFESVTQANSLEELEDLEMNQLEISLPTYDDASWPDIQLPHEGCTSDDFIPNVSYSRALNGVFWYRKSFEIENPDTDYKLAIGAIDDGDVTYINGKKIGATFSWSIQRNYTIPASLLNKGENTIAIMQYDSGGGSHLKGPIFMSNSLGDKVNLEGAWSGLMYADMVSANLIIYGSDNQEMLKQRPPSLNFWPNELASSLFNGMLHPLIPYNIKGAIWYQGESNVGRAEQYERLFPTMIKDWRTHWDKDFPFYFVQIAPFNYQNGKSPALRDAQRKSLSTPKTGMAITMDIGLPANIHPGNKQDVADRLSRLALYNDYKHDVVASGPLYKSHRVVGNKLIVEFDHIADGLNANNSTIESFEIAGVDKKFVPATAKIVGSNIEVFSTAVNTPLHVRYGWKDYLLGSLFNSEGLPASSFTTEN